MFRFWNLRCIPTIHLRNISVVPSSQVSNYHLCATTRHLILLKSFLSVYIYIYHNNYTVLYWKKRYIILYYHFFDTFANRSGSWSTRCSSRLVNTNCMKAFTQKPAGLYSADRFLSSIGDPRKHSAGDTRGEENRNSHVFDMPVSFRRKAFTLRGHLE